MSSIIFTAKKKREKNKDKKFKKLELKNNSIKRTNREKSIKKINKSGEINLKNYKKNLK